MKPKYKMLSIILSLTILAMGGCGQKSKAREFSTAELEFHDGVAWVQLKKDRFLKRPDLLGVACVDENGIEIFSMPKVQRNQVSNFYQGKALVQNHYIIDKTGTLVHDLKKELDIDKICLLKNNHYDGFIFVYKYVNGVAMTGMLNSNLEWVVEPTAKFNDMQPMQEFMYYNKTVGYYDALTNELIEEEEFQERRLQRCFPESGFLFLKRTGNSSFHYDSNGVAGDVELTEDCRTGFYNHNLEMVLDLEDLPSVAPISDWKDGKCLIEFKSERATFTGMINSSGAFIFIYPSYGFVDYNAERIQFKDCYFDWDGNCYSSPMDEASK